MAELIPVGRDEWMETYSDQVSRSPVFNSKSLKPLFYFNTIRESSGRLVKTGGLVIFCNGQDGRSRLQLEVPNDLSWDVPAIATRYVGFIDYSRLGEPPRLAEVRKHGIGIWRPGERVTVEALVRQVVVFNELWDPSSGWPRLIKSMYEESTFCRVGRSFREKERVIYYPDWGPDVYRVFKRNNQDLMELVEPMSNPVSNTDDPPVVYTFVQPVMRERFKARV